ncbi:MAG: DUF1127 domain-containing protein [Pseudomonadota bacterium]|nr:DUF1127 domain-containing protein [Pseudomonadota bacterium]
MTSQPPLFPHLVAAQWLHDMPTPVSVVARDWPHLRPVAIDPTDYEHYLARGRKMRAQSAGRLTRALSTMLGQTLDALSASVSRIVQRAHTRRQRQKTAAALVHLPPHLLRDIGLVPADVSLLTHGRVTVSELAQARHTGWAH